MRPDDRFLRRIFRVLAAAKHPPRVAKARRRVSIDEPRERRAIAGERRSNAFVVRHLRRVIPAHQMQRH